MMIIGFYCSSFSWGGLEMNFAIYALCLKSRGYNVKIYCVEGSPIAKMLLKNCVYITFINRNKKYFDLFNAYKIFRIFKKDRIRIIWLRDPRDLNFAGLVKSFFCNRIKIIYQQGMMMGTKKKDFFHTIRFSKIDAWITPLNYLAHQITELTRFNPEKIHIIPLATKYYSEKIIIPKSHARDILSIPKDKFVIGILGRIDPLKGQLFLIQALEIIRRQNPNVILLIVGNTTKEYDKYINLLVETAESLHLSEYILFRSFIENVEFFYNAIDLFALASKNETFGMVTIEAMTYNVPIIATNSSGTPEILEYGKLGILYEPDDMDDFCNKTTSIINNYDKAKEIALSAQKVALIKYNETKVYSEIEYLLSKL